MAQIETWFEQDIQKAVKVTYLDGNVFSADNEGNKVGVRVYSGGEPVTITGNISANVIRPDGTTVAVTGASSGNEAWIVMPQAAYAVPGIISIIIKNTVSSTVTTLCAVVATVYESTTSTVVDPGTIIPSIQTLITSIETAVASIPADYSALWTKLAPAFSSSTSYKAGQYVTYNSGLYRFNVDHSGSWVAADVTAVNIGGEIFDVNSALGNITGNKIIQLRKGYAINNSGSTINLDGATSRSGSGYAVIECSAGDVFTVNGTSGTTYRLWAFFNSSKTNLQMSSANAVGNNTLITAPANAAYLAINDLSGATVSYVGKLLQNKVAAMDENIAALNTQVGTNTSNISTNTLDVANISGEIGLAKLSGWQSGYIGGGTSANIATAVSSPTSSASWEYVIVECNVGDKFTINANSGTIPKAFYITDSAYNVLTRGDKNTYNNYVIGAPSGSKYLILNRLATNTKNTYTGALEKGMNRLCVGTDNMIWSWSSYPGIVSFQRVRNKLYWGYTSADGDIGVASYDFDTHEIIKNGLYNGQIDDHNNPAVYVCADGTIVCGFSTGHNFDYCMHIRRSSVPESVEKFDDDIIVAGIGDTSYCQMIGNSTKLYMFYRINNSSWVYRVSTDDGKTWSDVTQFMYSPEKVYLSVYPTTQNNRVRLLMYNNSTYSDSEIHQGFFDLSDGKIYNSDNSTLLGTSEIALSSFTTLIPLDNTLTHMRFFDAAVTAPGSPLIAYCIFEQGDDSEYRVFDSGNVTGTFVGGYGLMNYYQLGMAWRGTNQLVVAHGVSANGGSDLIDLYDYNGSACVFNSNIATVVRGSVPIRAARPIVDANGKSVLWQQGYYNRTDYTDFNMDARIHVFTT